MRKPRLLVGVATAALLLGLAGPSAALGATSTYAASETGGTGSNVGATGAPDFDYAASPAGLYTQLNTPAPGTSMTASFAPGFVCLADSSVDLIVYEAGTSDPLKVTVNGFEATMVGPETPYSVGSPPDPDGTVRSYDVPAAAGPFTTVTIEATRIVPPNSQYAEIDAVQCVDTASAFRAVRRPADITVGPDVCGTGNPSINLEGSARVAGDTWITVYDTTPADATVMNTFGDTSTAADVLIRPFNNKKGAGLLALFNEGTDQKGLALVIYDNGNTDRLTLGTVSKANGTFTVLTTVSLANRIAECNWYHLTMDVAVSGSIVTVTGNVFRHVTASNPNSAVVPDSVGSLSFTGPLPVGVYATGEVGIVGSATSAVEDSSVTNFTLNP